MTDEKSFINDVETELTVRFTPRQREIVGGAWRRRPTEMLLAIDYATEASEPVRYYVRVAAKVMDDYPDEPERPVARRHDLGPVLCLDCDDTGYVHLRNGDAAPCRFCETGRAKANRFGSIEYTRDDFDPAISEGGYRRMRGLPKPRSVKDDPTSTYGVIDSTDDEGPPDETLRKFRGRK